MRPDPGGDDRARLGAGAGALRALHTLIAVVQIAALGHVWSSALRRRRGPLLRLSMGALAAEGAALIVGRGDCPLGPLQERLGDPVPLFELVLPQRAAKAAVPILAAVAVTGMALVAMRPPRPQQASACVDENDRILSFGATQARAAAPALR